MRDDNKTDKIMQTRYSNLKSKPKNGIFNRKPS